MYRTFWKLTDALNGGVRQLAQADVLDDDVDLVGRGVREERFDDAALVVLRDGGVGQGRIQEEQRVGILALHRRPNAAEVLHDELCQEVAQLGRLRLVASLRRMPRPRPVRRRRSG